MKDIEWLNDYSIKKLNEFKKGTVMKKYTTEQGIVAPLDRANVDTDLIIPKQFLKSIKRTGFGDNLFDEVRY